MVAALTTLLVAYAAFRTIRSNREKEERDKKERLLNEIVEWAIDIAKCGLEKEFKYISQFEKDDPRSDRFVSAFFAELARNFQAIEGKSQYIHTIALKFEESLQKAVKELIETVEEHIDLLDECKVGQPGELEKAIGNVGVHNTPLRESARKIIEEATKIKTKNIGKKEENMSKEDEPTGSNEPTLKDIEEHLKRQDKKLDNGIYLSGYLFGTTLIFIAFGLLAGRYVLTTELGYAAYAIVLLIGGTGLTGFAWYKRKKNR